jgi:FKBP-type peptidyl-prolyl cis-trans isomerase
MKKISSYLFLLALMIIAASCRQDFKKTKSGLLYKIISDGKGAQVKKGEFIKLNYVQKLNDSVLYSSYNGFPGYARIDSVGPIYNPAEMFTFLRKGDSAVTIQFADTLQRKFGNLPPYIKKTDKVFLLIKVTDVFANQELAENDRKMEIQKEKDREDKILADYISSHKINAQKIPSGAYVEIASVGDGPAVDTGKQVSIMYSGKSFPEGKVFESNITGPHKDPYKFVIGKRKVIEGWDEGLRVFKKGGKGTLYIPAYLAYDAQPGPNHKPYENLIFDVEVVDVTDAPKEEQTKQQMPQISPEQLKKLQEQMQKKTK